jgi:hypothetical protein
VEANRDELVARSSAPNDPTDRRCIASEQVMWEGHRMN